MDNVFGYTLGSGFGDMWIFANNLAILSGELPEVRFNPVSLSHSLEESRPRYLGLITEILDCLDFNGREKIIPVYDPPTIAHFRYKNLYLRTKIKYTGESNYIVYQENATSEKPPAHIMKTFYDCLEMYKKKFEFIQLGKHMSVAKNIEVTSKAKAFIGFDSGMIHLCLGVGIPCYLTRLSWFFGGHTYGVSIVPSVEDMFKKACELIH